MKRVWLISLFVFFIIGLSSVSADEVPRPIDNYVNDFANVLDSSQQAELRDLFMQVEENTTAQAVFVSMESINDSLSNYALQIGREWGVGQGDKDNGMVILYVKDQNKIYVAVGYGLEGILPDSRIGRLLDQNYVPLRDEGEVGEGIIAFSYAASEVMIENAEEIRSGETSDSDLDNFLVFAFIFLFVVIIVVSIAKAQRRSRGRGFWLAPIFIPSGGNSGSGFSSGGFGGGSFGGGGAGR